MEKLEKIITEFENKIHQKDIVNKSVSKSSVGWHIEHSLLSIKLMIEALKNSDPSKFKWRFNKARIFVLTMNKIPRGKAQAPEISVPEKNFDELTLINNVKSVKILMEDLNNLKPNHYIEHPLFDDMNLRQTKKLLYIHTKHHLDIINDIISK